MPANRIDLLANAPAELSAYRRCNRKGWTAELNATPAERMKIKAAARAHIEQQLEIAVKAKNWTKATELLACLTAGRD